MHYINVCEKKADVYLLGVMKKVSKNISTFQQNTIYSFPGTFTPETHKISFPDVM